jgi:ABC-type dipeptide/oligopeptide/nickel transport system permease subunit
MARWIGFILAILLGAAAGMFYGWVVSPVEYVDTTPQTLRIDYKSDYVLMVAEAYSAEKDLAQAVNRLAVLGSDMPAEIVREAILFAESQGYTDADVAVMRSLGRDLDTWNPLPGQSP